LLSLPNELLLYTLTHFLDLKDLWILQQTNTDFRLFASTVIQTIWKIETKPDTCMKIQCRGALIALEALSNQFSGSSLHNLLNKNKKKDTHKTWTNDTVFLQEQTLHKNIVHGISSYKHQFVLIEDIDIRNRIRIAVDVIFHHTVFVSAISRYYHPTDHSQAFSALVARLLSVLDSSYPTYCREITFTLADNIKAFLEYTGYKILALSSSLSPSLANKTALHLTYYSISACFDLIGAAAVGKLLTESHVECAIQRISELLVKESIFKRNLLKSLLENWLTMKTDHTNELSAFIKLEIEK
ncbi:hypothetical protein BY458DRAFT_414352, partial [Sporodiniella umbellata]